MENTSGTATTRGAPGRPLACGQTHKLAYGLASPLACGLALVAPALLLAATPAQADIGLGGLTVSGSATLASDYRFRGVSYSDLGPALQADLTVETARGLFASVWASNSAEYPGADVEVNLSTGWMGGVGPATATAGVIGYLYPGGDGAATYELFSSVAMQLGPVTGTVGLNWAPGQPNLASSSRYLFGTVEAGIPLTPFTISATLGHERGAMVEDELGETTSKFDWQLGASATFSALRVGVAYVGNSLHRPRGPDGARLNRTARPGIVASATLSF